jgi:hypothetical protein
MILVGMTFNAMAQEEKPTKCNVSVGADLASMYLWRGFELGNSPALQPWAEFSYKGLAVGTWGSYDFTNTYKEVDVYVKYTYKAFSLMFIDLYTPSYDGFDKDYYNLTGDTSSHVSELGLTFNGTEKIPFTVTGGVLLYGLGFDHKVNDTTKLNYSTYFEVNYLGKSGDLSYNVFAGFTPSESYFYATDSFSFLNVGLSAKKAIKITDDFSLPIKLTLATNPTSKKIFLAMLISL